MFFQTQQLNSTDINELKKANVIDVEKGINELNNIDTIELKKERRSRAVFCGPHYSSNIVNMLKLVFGFSATHEKDPNWDIQYGAYPHCGRAGYKDWDMETGFNKVVGDKGWPNLKPWQVWFPCMGCRQSYCNKREFCKLQRDVDPSTCFVLPDDLEALQSKMDGKKLWVLKRDGQHLDLHTGKGITYIKKKEQIPQDLSDRTYLVQPYSKPFLGKGKYNRKSELRLYLAVTSTWPLRLYSYEKMWVVLASSVYTDDDISNKCIHDTHTSSYCKNDLHPNEQSISFEDYATKVEMSKELQKTVVDTTLRLISKIIHTANPEIQKNIVNQGIKESGASCFSYLRADIGITKEGNIAIFEINEFPFVNDNLLVSKKIVKDSHMELFEMIGLDQPPVYRDIERAKYEAAHTGSWKRLNQE